MWDIFYKKKSILIVICYGCHITYCTCFPPWTLWWKKSASIGHFGKEKLFYFYFFLYLFFFIHYYIQMQFPPPSTIHSPPRFKDSLLLHFPSEMSKHPKLDKAAEWEVPKEGKRVIDIPHFHCYESHKDTKLHNHNICRGPNIDRPMQVLWLSVQFLWASMSPD